MLLFTTQHFPMSFIFCMIQKNNIRIKTLNSIRALVTFIIMEQTNSLYFEHKGTKYSATVKEDITTEPKILLICPNETEEPGKEIKFELSGTEWVGPEALKN